MIQDVDDKIHIVYALFLYHGDNMGVVHILYLNEGNNTQSLRAPMAELTPVTGLIIVTSFRCKFFLTLYSYEVRSY